MKIKLIILLLFGITEFTVSQNYHIGILYNHYPKIIDENNNNAKHKFNMIGIDIRTKNQFLENLSTGIIIQYGEKNLLNDQSEEFNKLHDYDAIRDIQLLSFEIPFMYIYKIQKQLELEVGLKLGIERLSIDDRFNIYGTYIGGVTDIKNKFSASNYEFSYSPSFEFHYSYLDRYEILIGVEYKILDFSIKYENDNESLNVDPEPNEISANIPDYYYKINLTGISLSVGIKYIL